MALNGFAPSAYASFTALDSASGQIALPGAGTNTVVVNLGPSPAAVKLGTSSAVSVAGSGDGTVVMPGQSMVFTTGSNTNIAARSLGFGGAQLNVSVGS